MSLLVITITVLPLQSRKLLFFFFSFISLFFWYYNFCLCTTISIFLYFSLYLSIYLSIFLSFSGSLYLSPPYLFIFIDIVIHIHISISIYLILRIATYPGTYGFADSFGLDNSLYGVCHADELFYFWKPYYFKSIIKVIKIGGAYIVHPVICTLKHYPTFTPVHVLGCPAILCMNNEI